MLCVKVDVGGFELLIHKNIIINSKKFVIHKWKF